MKTKLFRFKVFAFFLALLLLTNCQEDDISMISNPESNVTQRIISLDDIQSMPGVMSALSNFKLQSTKVNSISQKIIYNSKYDFIVDTDKVLLIQRGNYHSLSFPVYRDVDNGLQENLFLHPYNGGYLTFLMKYRFTPQQLDKISKGIELSPSEEVENMTFIPLDEEYTTNGGDYSGTVRNINGKCYTWHSVDVGWIACPGCECPTPLEVPSGGSNYGTFTLYSFSGFGDGGGTTGSPTGGPFNPAHPGSTIGTPPTVIPGVPYPTPGNDYGIITNPGHSVDNSDDAIIGFIQPTNAEYARFVNKLTIAQKEFWNNGNNLDKVIKITSFLQENGYSPENVAFAKWAINYLISNPTVSISQFENWFMGKSEGQDGEYDAAYWENPNLTFTPQALPTFAAFESAFPKVSDPLYDTPEKMYNSIGGQVQAFYTGPNTNTCAIRLSKALNYSGVVIPNIPGKTFKGADNKYYFKAAYEINIWMRKTFGTNPATSNTPYNANHHQYTSTQAGAHGVNLPGLLAGKKGIYSIFSSDFSWASGHADLLYDNATCGNNCHFYDAPIGRLDIWELN